MIIRVYTTIVETNGSAQVFVLDIPGAAFEIF